jgi:hypothetical protein
VKQDPLALAFFGAALALLAGLLLYVIFGASRGSQPEPAQASASLPQQVRDAARKLVDKLDRPAQAPAPAAKPQPPPQSQAQAKPRPQPQARAQAPQAQGPAAPVKALQAGQSFRYAVQVQPEAWRDITLDYRTSAASGGLSVHTDFVHAGGKMNFNLGIFAAGHGSHANVRFPGFFMHPSYFPATLQPGQALSWSWAWQPQREGRVKRYDGRVVRWEDVQVPAGTFRTLRIDTELSYVEGGQVRAKARETLWYAPQLAQLVKVVREGRTPDEGLDRIVAELAGHR